MTAMSGTEVYTASLHGTSQDIFHYEDTRLLSPQGRLGVQKYMAQSILLTIMTCAFMASILYASGFNPKTGVPAQNAGLVIAAATLLLLAYVWLSCVMFIKRLHDVNLSGWFVLFNLIPVVGMFWCFFIIFAPGIQDGNRFGAAPHTALWEKFVGTAALVLIGVALLATIFVAVASLISF